MTGKKLLIVIVALVLLLAVLLLIVGRRRHQFNTVSVAGARDGSFVMQVEKPLFSLRAPWEVPRAIFGDRDPDLRISNTSPGARLGSVTPKRFELSADDGWDLVIESDGQGRLLEGTRLIFPISFGGGQFKFNCRQSEADDGYFNTTVRDDKLDGDFLLQVTHCKNMKSGKNASGLPVFPVRGSFKGLSQTSRPNDQNGR